MKNILLFISFISFANLQAQEINLRTMTKDEQIRYVSQEATKALDRHLHDFLEELYGSSRVAPHYYALSMSYKKYQLHDNESIVSFGKLYGDAVTDYIPQINDYIYTISFVSNPRLWKPLLYRVAILNNGKALTISVLDVGYNKIIYNK